MRQRRRSTGSLAIVEQREAFPFHRHGRAIDRFRSAGSAFRPVAPRAFSLTASRCNPRQAAIRRSTSAQFFLAPRNRRPASVALRVGRAGRHGSGRLLRCRSSVMRRAIFPVDFGRFRHARPRRVDAAKKVAVLDRLAFEEFEIFLLFAALDARRRSPGSCACVRLAASISA